MPNSPILSDAEILSDMGTDAQKWARQFLSLDIDPDNFDEGLMIGWFANAIEAGRSAGAPRPLEVGEGEVLSCSDCGAAVSTGERLMWCDCSNVTWRLAASPAGQRGEYPSVVEAVARAICEADCGRITDNEIDRCRPLAQAALDAASTAKDERVRECGDLCAKVEAVSLNPSVVKAAIASALEPYRYHLRPGDNAHLWIARRCADEVLAALNKDQSE